jgi:hypothetical protein
MYSKVGEFCYIFTRNSVIHYTRAKLLINLSDIQVLNILFPHKITENKFFHWISSRHNMGMTFTKDLWKEIKKCSSVSILMDLFIDRKYIIK